jgi:hypothetical protein
MILGSPIGSSVYFVFPFIDLFTLSPVTGTKDPDRVSAHGESHCQNTVTDPSDTIIPLLSRAVARVLRNNTLLVEKRLLCHREGYTVFLLVFFILCVIPLESSSLHVLSLSDPVSPCNIIIWLSIWFVKVRS